MNALSKQRNTTLKKLSLHIFLVTFTNIICWCPTMIISMMSLFRMDVLMDIIAGVAIFVMPINSAFNPIIFTFKHQWKQKCKKLQKSD